ncbi:MAG TPA: acyl-CoA thioesterase domain-containing protein [Acidimicrobiales bacterium]|jgi:acyl-CoA thioesterase|nr:acyl-CoA thioesterase domain-containing protein [Acidimicrobiales bacterium]
MTWGDAADLIDILDVRPAGPLEYLSVVRGDSRRPVVEGSQMLGQAIVAAGRHTPSRRPVSTHMLFLRAADARLPLGFTLAELATGRTFDGLAADVHQAGRRVAHGAVLLDRTDDDLISHGHRRPDVGDPDDAEPFDMGVSGREIRVVDGAYTGDPDAPVGPPVLDVWVRFDSVPDDQCLHDALLAQFTGHMSIAAALRPHPGVGQDQAHRTLSTAVNAISLSLHAPVRADRWMLYHHESTFAGSGMTHSSCTVHDEEGTLLASFSTNCMVRRFAAAAGPVDGTTAL